MKRVLTGLLLGMFATAALAQSVTVTVKNSLKTPRYGEMIEVSVADLKQKLNDKSGFIVTDVDGNELPSQVTYDGKLIFQVGVPAKGVSRFFVKGGTARPYEPRVFGRHFPERVDDIAWENDRVAFRTYGPALQKNNEKAYGFDIWNKRTSKLVVEDRYAGELDANVTAVTKKLRDMGKGDLADDVYNAVSYHVDHGTGMDCYKVGSTLGSGTPALLAQGEKIVYPWCWKEFEILDKGPIRFTVKLVYNPETVNGVQVTETRIVSLDAGSHMNKCVVSYAGLTTANPVCAGIVVHKENPTAYVMNVAKGYMGYEDLGDPNQYKEKYRAVQNKDFGRIYVGAVFPGTLADMKYKEEAGLPGANGHILGIASTDSATPFTYYFGSGWSRNAETDITSLAKWEGYLDAFAQHVRNPLKVTVK